MLARGIEQAAQRIGRAEPDVRHHQLRLAASERGAVRHRDRDVLVRHQHRLDAGAAARERLDERRKVGARVAEQARDAVLAHPREVALCDGFLRLRHARSPSQAMARISISAPGRTRPLTMTPVAAGYGPPANTSRRTSAVLS